MDKISPFNFLYERPKVYEDAHSKFFTKALELSQYCMGSTHPNPNVGAVLVKNNKVISEGYTHKKGDMHAEVHAIKNACGNAHNATLYVTLEPCSHFGCTPPCINAIADAKISNVYFGIKDENPYVLGNGQENLKLKNIECRVIPNKALQKKAHSLITPFRKLIFHKRPYVVAKIATSKDKKITKKEKTQSKITSHDADVMVHNLRRASDCIMVGAHTVRVDNPLLTARLGNSRHNTQPLRIVLNAKLDLDYKAYVFDTSIANTHVFHGKDTHDADKSRLNKLGIKTHEVSMIHGLLDLKHVLSTLGSLGITSVMIEPGVRLLSSLLGQNLIDEIWWFRSREYFGKDAVGLKKESIENIKHQFSLINKISLLKDDLSVFLYNGS